jgi:DNA-binding NarL/FixJ family response regulator
MSVANLHELRKAGAGQGENKSRRKGFGGPLASEAPGRMLVTNAVKPLTKIAVILPPGLARECLVQFVLNSQSFDVAEYQSVEELINSESKKNFSLVILSSAMKGNSAVNDEIAQIKTECASCRIVAIVESCDVVSVKALLTQGVRGVVPTTFPAKIVLQAISFVLSGGIFAPAETFLKTQKDDVRLPGAGGSRLTNREQQIINLLRTGQQNKQIAYELGLSIGTVKVHLCNIMKKLGTHNRVQALAHHSLNCS